jgi:phospholipid/cholesterol/gamma-HCH transport system ATP-binding protein
MNKEDQPDIKGKDIVISIRGLQKSFGEHNVLKGIDLELHKGENLVVMGRSGSGKSVLIKIIAGLIPADKGTVRVFDKDINQINHKELTELRLKIGFLFQGNALYDSMTIRENLEFPLVRNNRNIPVDEIDKAVQDVLKAVGLPDSADKYPEELSGGQQKRIGIARTLILKPAIIFYDEPTAGLDPITSGEMNDLMNDVQHQFNTSSIIITHDLTCAKAVGDRIFMLIDGKFVRQGDFEEVFETDDERIKAFYDYNFIQ